MKTTFRTLFISLPILLGACSTPPMSPALLAPDAVFSVQAQGQRVVVRALTRAAVCPDIEWDNHAPQPMDLRVGPATIAQRAGGAQPDNKAAVFDVRTCEAEWPAGAQRAQVAGRVVPAPAPDIQRIVIVADTGCRLQGSNNSFQACNDAAKWPWAQVASSAAALKPDLVIHLGDLHYRESPCPPGNAGCAGSPWGFGYDTWQADFFQPAAPLLAAAPWVFVRGNHESCFRAGQGWFRFIDPQAWSAARSCNEPALDGEADYSPPYAVPLTPSTQLLVFDSSKTAGKAFPSSHPAFAKYAEQLRSVEQLSQQKKHNFFASHHPLLAVAPADKSNALKPGGNAGLQSVFGASYPQRLFPAAVDVALHGHVHFFEAISFKSDHPASLVLGNSASAIGGRVPRSVAAGTQLFPGAVVDDYAATDTFGFATLDRVGASVGASSAWLLTEYNTQGVPLIRCALDGPSSRCALMPAYTPGGAAAR